ncbi:MAG: hypothetical protein FVQ84_08535 [Planctomycetes bacterium]|nr:hypothetical protein [Planctomycetota bacterium]
MRYGLDIIILQFDGKQLNDVDGSTLTLKKVCVNALLAQAPDQNKMKGEEKIERYNLAKRVHEADEGITLTQEECVLIKEQVATLYNNNLVIGRLSEVLK